MFSRLASSISKLVTLICLVALLGVFAVFAIVFHYSRDLPDFNQLADYNPPTVTRLYANDGQMLAEYAKEKRLFVPIKAIPARLKNAFIATEDKNFYNNPGIDFISIMRAAVTNLLNYGHNKSLAGGSTITQQVVKNFLLTNEKSLSRKIKEAILAFRITQAFSKDRILELYLNEIYLGNRSYGVAAAALNYFNKSMDELEIEEAAMLAALPKAPSSLNPHNFYEKAKARRNWVIKRMAEEGYISDVEAALAMSSEIVLADRAKIELVNAQFYSDSVKQELYDMYGEDKIMEGGLVVHTNLVPKYQKIAEEALMQGLIDYDRRHGWRGAIQNISLDNWQEQLAQINAPETIKKLSVAVVRELNDSDTKIGLKDGTEGTIPLKDVLWARKFIDRDTIGGSIKKPSDVLKLGDVILVSDQGNQQYSLEQLPEVNGAIVALNPHTGRVLAMVGGYFYGESQFNRVTQAKRQPGSSFKPFVYLSALENGFAPNSIIVDEEVQLEVNEDMPEWRPQNHSGEYYGPTTLRVGVEKSRNAMTVRLSQLVGIDKIVKIAKRFGINPDPARNFSVALGTAETTLLKLTTAYAILVNGGKKIEPSLIEYIQDSDGKMIYKRDGRTCLDCIVPEDETNLNDIPPPELVDNRKAIADPINAYQIVSILEGVIQRGTGSKAKSLNRTLGGKTGTTNASFDAWFLGFNPDLVAGVFVGFDTPQSLGSHEYGSSAALPIWMDFMKQALADKPDIPFRRPAGVKLVKIDAATGLLPSADTPKSKIIYEAFKAGTEPTSSSAAVNNSDGTEDSIVPGGVY